MDDHVIDLGEYARRRAEAAEPARTTFSIWGGEGERARFALPLWRAAYLVSMTRAALAWERSGEAPGELEPEIVLDLGEEPARTQISGKFVARLRGLGEPPGLQLDDDGGAVFLGEKDGRRWYVVVADPSETATLPRDNFREDLLFLAGECAGLLFHRDLNSGSEQAD